MPHGHPAQDRADLAEVGARAVRCPDEQAAHPVPVRDQLLGLGERLPDEPPPPQREPARLGRARSDRGSHHLDEVVTLRLVCDHHLDRLASAWIDQPTELAIEVGRDPSCHTGLDQALQPGLGAGAQVEVIDDVGKGRHRTVQRRAELTQPPLEAEDVLEVGRRIPAQHDPALQIRCRERVHGQRLIGRQLAVGEHTEQVDRTRDIVGIEILIAHAGICIPALVCVTHVAEPSLPNRPPQRGVSHGCGHCACAQVHLEF